MNQQQKTPLPDLGRHHALEFLAEHDQIQRDLMAERSENKQLFKINCDLANENHLLKERLQQSDERVAFLQGFSKTVIARFAVITEAVDALKKEAWDNGMKVAKAPHAESEEERKEAEEVARLIAALPEPPPPPPTSSKLPPLVMR